MKTYFGNQKKYILNYCTKHFVIFSEEVSHDQENGLFGTSAGFCKFYIEDGKIGVECFGESVSLMLKSNQEIDSEIITNSFKV